MQPRGPVVAATMTVVVIYGVLAHAAGQRSAPVVRSEAAVLRAAFVDGCRRSSTFRSLGDRVAAADGVVHVEAGTCGGRPGCLLHWMAVAGHRRFLRVLVDVNGVQGDLVARIAHELQHVVEVLADPTIRTPAGIYWRFRAPFVDNRRTSETAAADTTGERVRSELKRSSSEVGSTRGCGDIFTID